MSVPHLLQKQATLTFPFGQCVAYPAYLAHKTRSILDALLR
jgi:hypothetical protein